MGIFKKIKETMDARSFRIRPNVSSAEMTDFIASKYTNFKVINRGNDRNFRVQILLSAFFYIEVYQSKNNQIFMLVDERLLWTVLTLGLIDEHKPTKALKIIHELYPLIKEKFGV